MLLEYYCMPEMHTNERQLGFHNKCNGVVRTPKDTLATARMQIAAREIVLWTTPSEPPKALQASECSELLDPMRASCQIPAQH